MTTEPRTNYKLMHRSLLLSFLQYLYSQAVWPDWAIYWTLGNFSKPMATINLPKSPSYAIFVKVSKTIIFLVKSFLGNFYRHLANFYWSQALIHQAELDGNLFPLIWCKICNVCLERTKKMKWGREWPMSKTFFQKQLSSSRCYKTF